MRVLKAFNSASKYIHAGKTQEVNSEETAIPLIRLQKVIKTHALKDQQ